MYTKTFWHATFERAVRTAAQTLVATLALDTTGVLDVNWAGGLSLAASAALLAVLTAVGAAPLGPDGPGLTERPAGRGPEPGLGGLRLRDGR